MLALKRVYEPYSPDDGLRVLVDRLWPRGESKEKARVDVWLKDIAPSNELRKWFGHDPEKWEGFKKKYHEELRHNPSAVAEFRAAVEGHGKVTLLFGAKDEEHNEAVALKEFFA